MKTSVEILLWEGRYPDGRFYCGPGDHPIKDDEYFYTPNPPGGYGRPALHCCEACIRKPENDFLKQRMIECADAKELND